MACIRRRVGEHSAPSRNVKGACACLVINIEVLRCMRHSWTHKGARPVLLTMVRADVYQSMSCGVGDCIGGLCGIGSLHFWCLARAFPSKHWAAHVCGPFCMQDLCLEATEGGRRFRRRSCPSLRGMPLQQTHARRLIKRFLPGAL